MIGSSILSRFEHLAACFEGFSPAQQSSQPDLHSAWLEGKRLPEWALRSPVVRRYLDLLGPLTWQGLPERNLSRNWGHTTIPHRAFIPACLLKLNEGKESMGQLRLYLVEHPELIWLFGFPLVISNSGFHGFDASASLPTHRHLVYMLQTIPNSTLQFLLADSVYLIQQALAQEGFSRAECISLDTKHIIAYVKENNSKAYLTSRFVKTRQPVGDADCRLGCKRRHNRRKTERDSGANTLSGKDQSVGEFYWGYGSGVVVVKVPGWGEYILAEMTQTFDKPDASYFFPLMAQVEQRLGYRPKCGTFDAAFDAWYVHEYFYRADDPCAFAAVPFGEKGGYKAKGRQFGPDGWPMCSAGLRMHRKVVYLDRTHCIIPHQRGKYVCPLHFPAPTGESCPCNHKRWAKGGCTADMPTSIGASLRYTLDRDGEAYKQIYKQRTATERINSQAKALGIERPILRNFASITNQNTLIYILINLRLLQRIRNRQTKAI